MFESTVRLGGGIPSHGRNHARIPGLVVALVALVMPVSAPVAAAAPAPACTSRVVTSGFHEKVLDGPTVSLGAIPADVQSVPNWSGSFTTDGQAYPYTMVGTDPAKGSATTTVPVLIVPLQMDFPSTHCTLADDGMAADFAASPMFQPTPTPAGTTQYLDAIQRGSFWSSVTTTSPDYHLLLSPTVAPTQTLHVPGAQGLTFTDAVANRQVGVVGSKWLSLQLHSLIDNMHIDPHVLAVFLAYNTYATDENPTDCLTTCGYYGGFHTAALNTHNTTAINTYVYASVEDYGDALPPGFDLAAYVASHEILEWAADPFIHGTFIHGQAGAQANLAPSWLSPYDPFGCSSDLEVADPLEDGPDLGAVPSGSSTTYLLANAAFLSWFARQSPSTAILGRYDAGGVFSTYSSPC